MVILVNASIGSAALRRAAALALMAGAAWTLGACGAFHLGDPELNDAYDYRKAKPSQEPLEVPPDLSQLPKDDRYSLPAAGDKAAKPANANAAGASNGAVPAATAAAAPPAVQAAATSGAAVPGAAAVLASAAPSAPNGAGVAPAGMAVDPFVPGTHIVRDGAQRWLDADVSPEVAYATVKDLWVSMGMKIKVDDPALGLLETNWTEVRPDIDEDALRNGLHRLLGLFDSNGIRNKYRARIERTARNTAQVTITNQGMVEVYTSQAQDTTKWQWRAPDPELEALMLQRVALRFTQMRPLQVAVAPALPAAAGAVVAPPLAAAPAPATTPAPLAPVEAAPAPLAAAAPAVTSVGPGGVPLVEIAPGLRVHKVTAGGQVTLQVEDTLDNTWRRVGIALDRGSFTVEDRRRDIYTFYVGYLDPDYVDAEKAKRGWWDRVFNSDAPVPEQKFQIAVSANGPTTAIAVHDKDGHPDSSATATHILDQLQDQLR